MAVSQCCGTAIEATFRLFMEVRVGVAQAAKIYWDEVSSRSVGRVGSALCRFWSVQERMTLSPLPSLPASNLAARAEDNAVKLQSRQT